MKKVLLSLMALLLVSCGTINQVETYGTVEDVYWMDGHYRIKAWCQSKWKYYRIKTDKFYKIGDVIRIK